MAQRRKSLSEKDIRTVLAVIESYQEQNHYSYDEMNRNMGSITIEEMTVLKAKLSDWYHENDVVDEYEDVELDDYSSNAPCDTYGMCAGTSCSHYYECHKG